MKANEYEVIVEDCRNSGLTTREYSERIGGSVHTLHTWIRRTRKRYGITSDKKEQARLFLPKKLPFFWRARCKMKLK